MRVLIVLMGYFPAQKYGGPPVSVENFSTVMSDEIETYIVTSDHEMGTSVPLESIKHDVWQKHGKSNVLYLSKNEMKEKYYQKIINEVKPDWIYLNSLFDAKRTWPFLKLAVKNKVKVLLAPRGELCKNAFKKKYKKIPYIWMLGKYLRNPLVEYQSTCEEETNAICDILHVSSDRVHSLDNIPSVPSEQRTCKNKERGQLKIVFFSRLHPKKNLLFALECLSSVKGNVSFDIYGPQEDSEYWKKCEQYIQTLPANITVEYKGIIEHSQIQKVLNQYQLFFFPTLSENYGHVIAEALFAGLPILISDQTPWSDVAEYGAGKALSLDSQEPYVKYLEAQINSDNETYMQMSQNAIDYVLIKTDVEKIKGKYRSVFNRVGK